MDLAGGPPTLPVMREPPPPGTPITLHLIEDRRSLGQRVLSRLRGKVAGEPPNVPDEAGQWWFMLGWVTRGVAFGLPDDDALVVDAFEQWTLGTGESRVKGTPEH